jgi:hypothetical protein
MRHTCPLHILDSICHFLGDVLDIGPVYVGHLRLYTAAHMEDPNICAKCGPNLLRIGKDCLGQFGPVQRYQ